MTIPGGDPVAGAKIELAGPGAQSSQLTGSTGEFEFVGLGLGTYTLRLSLPLGFEASGEVERQVQVQGDVTVAFSARAVREHRETLAPGQVDTLATSTGVMLVVDASGATAPVTVSLSEEAPSQGLEELGVETPVVRLEVGPASGSPSVIPPLAGSVASRSGALTLVVTMIQRLLNPPVAGAFVFDAGPSLQPLLLWSDPADLTVTSFTDPNTGETGTVALTSQTLDASAAVNALMRFVPSASDPTQSCQQRALETEDGNLSLPSGQRALILVHGLQLWKLFCSDFSSLDFSPEQTEFGDLIQFMMPNGQVTHDRVVAGYKIYWVRYPTFEPILTTSSWLLDQIRANGLEGAVVVGHSMGGLVGRGALAVANPGEFGGLVTLGTPHEGSPFADFAVIGDLAARLAVAYSQLGLPGSLGNLNLGNPILVTPGVSDMATFSSLIGTLDSERDDAERVFTFGSRAQGNTGGFWGLILQLAESALMAGGAGPNDGVVPTSSSMPTWTTHQTEVANYNHFDVAEDPTGLIFPEIEAILDVLLGACRTAPAPPAANDFPLSGAIARSGARTIDVTLNPIVVGGTPVTGLQASNFMIIEDDCIRPHQITTQQGSIGVDIVFAQDLSSSMGGAIAGVRSSVLAFAADLASRGINVKLGSVGFSGPGTTPSSPASSSCEFLGPTQDMTDPATFQAHVVAAWIAFSGCDPPENGLEAIEYAHQNLNWRAGAARVYIDITDVSHHQSTTSCNGAGPCTDHDLASVVSMVGSTSTIHAVAPLDPFLRTYGGGLDPWLLAGQTGGQQLDLGNGVVDLIALGIADVIGETVRLSFDSSSSIPARHRVRVRVEVPGCGGTCVAELSPGLIHYEVADKSLRRLRR